MSKKSGPSEEWLKNRAPIITTTCSRCGSEDIFEDHAQGSAVCTRCGFVVSNCLLDDDAEWRTFDDDTKDKSRVGSSQNSIVPEQMTSTIEFKKDAKSRSLARTNAKANTSTADKNMMDGVAKITEIASQLGLHQVIRDEAHIIFSDSKVQAMLRGKRNASVYSACLYIACRLTGNTRSLVEFCDASKMNKTKIGKAFNAIKKVTGIELKTIQASNFVVRFCTKLNLPQHMKKVSEEVAENVDKLDIAGGKVPITIAGAIILMVTQLSSDHKRPIEEIANEIGISDSTIRNCYRDDLQPHQDKIVPKWFMDMYPQQ